MVNAAKLVGGVMGAAADVITRIVELVGKGQLEQAKEVADRFVATTKTQLEHDRDSAEDILARRFPRPRHESER